MTASDDLPDAVLDRVVLLLLDALENEPESEGFACVEVREKAS